MIEVIETKTFSNSAKKKLDSTERAWLISFLQDNPTVGVLEPGTGGARKIRMSAPGRGKSGGYRVIYFYWATESQVWLIDIYAKNEQDFISKKELRNIIESIKA